MIGECDALVNLETYDILLENRNERCGRLLHTDFK